MQTGNGSKTMRRYDLRADGRWLALVVITDDGYFSTVSDYGSYAYWWSSAGDDFRRFLIGRDDDYVVGKLAPGYEYHGDATLAAVKEAIIQVRRSGALTRDEARDEWELMDDHSEMQQHCDFAMWSATTAIESAHECYRSRRSPRAVAFYAKVWPALCVALRAELAAEACAIGGR